LAALGGIFAGLAEVAALAAVFDLGIETFQYVAGLARLHG